MQILTVKCKLIVAPEQAKALDCTLQAFAKACNLAIEVGRENNLSSNTKIHPLCYKTIREQFGLSANLACRAIARAAGILKVKERKHSTVKPTSVDYDERIFSFNEHHWTVGLTTTQGRLKFPLAIGDYQRNLLQGQKPTSATLSKSRQGIYYINIQVKLEPVDSSINTGKPLGIDLGIKRIATTSQGRKWDGKELNEIRNQFAKMRAALQRKKAQNKKAGRSTRSLTRLLKRLSGRERRFQTWMNHNIAKEIVNLALETNSIIRMEDLAGIRERAKVRKKQRRTQHNWAFYQLRQTIQYKAALAGITVELVNPRYTSQTCSSCQTRGKRAGLVFQCLNSNCGVVLDADINGACNIAAGGVVTHPETSAVLR